VLDLELTVEPVLVVDKVEVDDPVVALVGVVDVDDWELRVDDVEVMLVRVDADDEVEDDDEVVDEVDLDDILEAEELVLVLDIVLDVDSVVVLEVLDMVLEVEVDVVDV